MSSFACTIFLCTEEESSTAWARAATWALAFFFAAASCRRMSISGAGALPRAARAYHLPRRRRASRSRMPPSRAAINGHQLGRANLAAYFLFSCRPPKHEGAATPVRPHLFYEGRRRRSHRPCLHGQEGTCHGHQRAAAAMMALVAARRAALPAAVCSSHIFRRHAFKRHGKRATPQSSF